MRLFLAGVFLGALAVAAFWATISPRPPERRSERPAPPAPRTEQEEPARTRPSHDQEAAPRAEFPPGTAVLGIGDGYVFGEPSARPGAKEDEVDLFCEDIRHGASLRCPNGVLPADVPLAAVGLPEDAADVAALVRDAPPDLPARDVSLRLRSREEAPGVALVRAASGKTYKVYLVSEEGHPNALRRRVRIAYEEVPVVEGGGVVRLPATRPAGDAGSPTQKDIRALYEIGRAVPGASFAGHILGPYERLSEIPAELELTKERYLLFDAPLATKVTLERRGAVYAAAGIAPSGHVVLDSYAAVAVKGPMEGTIDVKSYGFIHVAGDLRGAVNIDSYATVVIDGDLLGTLKIRSYTTLLLRGRVLGTLGAKGSCWSTFYLQTYLARADLERLAGDFRQVTLHLRESDLPPGSHKGVGTWREVIVGDPAWQKLAR